MDPMNQMPQMMGGAPPPPAVNAKEALNIPSLLLILLGALGVVQSLASLPMYLGDGKLLAPLLEGLKDLPPEWRRALEKSLQGSVLNYAQIGLVLVASAFIAFGAWQMRNVRSYGLALAAAILSMLPCFSCCCCLGLPVGIWAIVIMNKPEVKAQFT